MCWFVIEGGFICVIEVKEIYWVGGDDIFIGFNVYKLKYLFVFKSEWLYGGI